MSPDPLVAIVGTGPAGLMAAHVVAAGGIRVRLYERRAGPGRKILIAGSTGLNITYDAPLDEIIRTYGGSGARMAPLLEAFPPASWLGFVESLGLRVFRGSSRRWFLEGLKGLPLLTTWLDRLRAMGVGLTLGKELVDFDSDAEGVHLSFADGGLERCDAAVLALGGASWERPGVVRWPALFDRRGLAFEPFRPSNAGFQVAWPPAFLAEAEGKPLKNVVMRSSRGLRAGDLVVTRYGLEGTPVYFAGEVGTVTLDLKPDLSLEQIAGRLRAVRENYSPIRRVRQCLKLSPAALALVFHLAPLDRLRDPVDMAGWIKRFPLQLLAPQPIEEAISSAGGVSWSEIDEALMLRRRPGVFVAGEMIDWDAPTGGFLFQGCVSQGHEAGQGVLRWLSRPRGGPDQGGHG